MITGFTQADRGRWAELWAGYLTFYKTSQPPEVYDFTWRRLFDGRLHGLGARDDAGRLIGITHFLYHESAWSLTPVCYLQDLFVDPEVRGSGAGRALIEGVDKAAGAAGVTRLYWQTQADNETARRLYDRLAVNRGFIRYDYIGGG